MPPTAKIGDICRKFIAEQAQAIFVAQKGKLRPNRARLVRASPLSCEVLKVSGPPEGLQ